MSAIAALIGGAVSAGASLLGTHMKNEAQKRESELAYQRQKAAIKEQNAYNSPSAQMARLQAAGLNPNLMYEQSKETAAGLQSDIPEYQPAQIDNAVSPMGAIGEQTINSLVGLKDMENKTMLAESQLLVNASTAGVNWSQVHLNEAQEKQILDLLGLQKEEIDSRIREANSRIFVNENQAKELMERVQNYWQERKESGQRISKMSAEEYCMRALLSSQINLNYASGEQLAAAALKAYEEMRYIGAYYYLDTDKFDFQKYSFEKGMENQNNQNRLDRRAEYWKMGLDSGVQVLGLVSSFVNPSASLARTYGGNVWNRASQSTLGSPKNSPSGTAPTPWYNKTHPTSKRIK